MLEMVQQIQQRTQQKNDKILLEMNQTAKRQSQLEQDQQSQAPKLSQVQVQEYRALFLDTQERLRVAFTTSASILYTIGPYLEIAEFDQPEFKALEQLQQFIAA
jgi:hypothetical protein